MIVPPSLVWNINCGWSGNLLTEMYWVSPHYLVAKTKSILTVKGNKSSNTNSELLHFNIVHALLNSDEYKEWFEKQTDSNRWGCIFFSGIYGACVYDKFTSPAELVNHHKDSSKRCLTISNLSSKWREEDKIWLRATKTIYPGMRFYTAYGVGSSHHMNIRMETDVYNKCKDATKVEECSHMTRKRLHKKTVQKKNGQDEKCANPVPSMELSLKLKIILISNQHRIILIIF